MKKSVGRLLYPNTAWYFALMLQLYAVWRLLLCGRRWTWGVALAVGCTAVQMLCQSDGHVLAWLRYNCVGNMLPFVAGWLAARHLRCVRWPWLVAAVAFDKPAMPVDAHVFRVAARIGLTHDSKNPLETERQLVAHIPQHILSKAHHWLILHGRYVCMARKPKCEKCGICDFCDFFKKNIFDLTIHKK